MINKITISKNKKKVLHRDRRLLGMRGENLQDTLLFCLDEKIEGTGIVEVELPDGKKGMIEVERTEEGYELPVKSSLLSQTGFVKFQLRILHDNEEIFKSEIIPLEVKDSINATATIPEEYPSWVDTLTNLKKNLEKAESERVSNENTRNSNEDSRIANEKERQINYANIQEKVSNGEFNGATYLPNVDAEGNISWTNNKGLENPSSQNIRGPQGIQGAQGEPFKIKKTYSSIEEMQTDFDNMKVGDYAMIANSVEIEDNAKLYYRTETEWVFITDFSGATGIQGEQGPQGIQGIQGERGIGISKLEVIDGSLWVTLTDSTTQNAGLIITDEVKQWIVNQVTDNAKSDFNTYYDGKVTDFDNHVTVKINEFNQNAKDKTNEFNQNAKELINKVEQVQAENKLIKEQIPSASASGNSVHIEDSGTLDFDWKIRGGHAQAITTQPENYIDDREARGKTILEATSLYLPIVNLKAGNGYYFKIFDNNNKIQNDSRYLAAEFYNENKVKIRSGPLGFSHNFTEEMATKVKYAKIYYNGNDTDKVIGNTIIKKIGLKITSNVSADDIDMFVPNSPSPNYSSEIETVGSNVNFIPTNPDEWEQGSISNGKNISSTTRIRSKSFIDIVEGEDYYLSIQDNQYRFVNIALYKDDNTYLNAYSSYDITIKKEYFLKVNFPTSCKKIRFVIRKVDDTSSIIPSEIDVIKPKLEKGTVQTPWSPYNQGSVEIDVVNSNLLDFNVAQDSRVTVNKDGTLTINGTGGFGLNIDKLQLKAGITYYQKVELISGSISGSNINNTFLSFAGAGAWISSENFSQTNLTKDTEKTTIWINASAIFNNAVIKIWANTDKSDFVKHQSQTAIMPIQQEMLEGDYIADVEHHEWRKYVFTGEENIGKSGIEANNSYWINQNSIPDLLNAELLNDSTAGTIVPNFLSTHFKTLAPKYVVHHNNIGITLCANNGNLKDVTIRFGFGLNSDINTVDKCKTWLKSQYDAGTPVTISYKLATPIDLELTEEQKRVQNQKLYTYKNVTNIAVSDELASIDVTYKKDLETEHNKLQNEIDEIKQLIGTTETSALLLDNLQKDVESEVE